VCDHSDIKVVNNLMGWGKVKETDQDCGVKVSRNAMFNFRIKFKGIKFPCPDPTVPAKDFILKMTVWHSNLLGEHVIAEGLLPLQPLFLDCMQVCLKLRHPSITAPRDDVDV
jgi:hypothetical protein